MRARIDRLDAVIYTHAHADHIMGLDDIRPYNLKQSGSIPIYGVGGDAATAAASSSPTFSTTRRLRVPLPGVELHVIDGPFEFSGWNCAGSGAARPAACWDFASVELPI